MCSVTQSCPTLATPWIKYQASLTFPCPMVGGKFSQLQLSFTGKGRSSLMDTSYPVFPVSALKGPSDLMSSPLFYLLPF